MAISAPPKKRTSHIALSLVFLILGTVAIWLAQTSHAIVQLPQTQAANQNPTWDTDAAVKNSVPGQILVRFRASADAAKASLHSRLSLKTARQISLQIERLSGGAEVVEGLRLVHVAPEDTGAAIEALNSREDVVYAEPNYVWHANATPNDPRLAEQTHLDFIQANSAWDITTGSSSVVVGVLDGGVDINHEDLRDNIWTNPGEVPANGIDDDGNGFIDDVHGWDFHHNDNAVFDNEPGDDHATHVAGIIGARGNNSIGVSGVCWQVGILPLKVLGPNGGSVSNIIAGYGYARAMRERGVNLQVLNNSYGGPVRSLAVEDAIQQLNHAGMLFVVSAGNDQKDLSRYPVYPANYDVANIMVVSANAQFSNFGATRVHVSVPGSSILSTTPNNTYSFATGTSMAAPQVSGAAALLISAKPDITTALLKRTLIYSNATPQSSTAKSLLNINKALLTIQENDVVAPAPPVNFRFVPLSPGGFELAWTATGDDGNTGKATDYELTFITNSEQRIPINTIKIPQPAGAAETQGNISVPLRHPTGRFELRTFDNAGNSSAATAASSVDSFAADPYSVALSPNEPLSTGGQRLALDGDDQYFVHSLPFNVLIGGNFSRATVSTNGLIHFGLNPPEFPDHSSDDYLSSVEYLNGLPVIAGLWTDLIIDQSRRADAGVYAVQPNNDVVIFRWQANTLASNAPVNFEIELRRDGNFICRYGDGNLGISPVVGLSVGRPESYAVASHTHEYWQSGGTLNLDHAETVTFNRRIPPPAVVFDFNPYTFQVSENTAQVVVTVARPSTVGGLPTLGSYSVTYTTSAGSALPGVDYVETTGTLTFNTGEATKSFPVTILSDTIAELNETFTLSLSNPTNGSGLGNTNISSVTILDDDTPVVSSIQCATANTSVNENSIGALVNVTRSGDLSFPASVDYATSDLAFTNPCDAYSTGKASSRCDYEATLGTLRFAAGETSKTITVPVVNDSYLEGGAESFSITLSNPLGAGLGAPSTTTIQINDSESTSNGPNPINEAAFFVRLQYIDFLNREPDESGLAFWRDQITSCGSDQTCVEVKRINVSAAFFLSIEFQETGYLAYRMYKAAYGNLTGKPVPVTLNEFLPDSQEIGRGVIVGTDGWAAMLENNKAAFAQTFVLRQRFVNAYSSNMTPPQFVDKLFLRAGINPTVTERAALIMEFPSTTSTGDLSARGRVLRRVAENGSLSQQELNNAFVLMQYFGYLRRNPNDWPESSGNFSGYNFWLGKLNQFNGNFVSAEMVKAFLVSGEYRNRFGP